MTSSLADAYLARVFALQQETAAAHRDLLRDLGARIGASLAAGGVLHLFGSGHSHIVAQEMERRAGGLVPVSTLDDPTHGWAEQIPGFGARLVERYAFQYGLQPGEFIIVISNSGKNSSPLEVALAARARGLHVIALTSLEMSRAAASLHPSGHRLFEIADFVLDNRGVPGDAAVPIPGHSLSAGPTSTLTGALLLNLLHLEIIAWLADHAPPPLPLLISQNLPHGPDHNRALAERYRHRIRRPIG